MSYASQTVHWQASLAVYQYKLSILSPLNDKYPSSISRSVKLTIEMVFHDQISNTGLYNMITVKFLNFRTPENVAVIYLKFKEKAKP